MKTRDPQELIQKRKKQILSAAMLVFARKGFAKARMEDISRKAGLGKGTVYQYFQDKADLFMSAFQNGMDELSGRIHAALDSGKDPLEKIVLFTMESLQFFETHAELIDLIHEEQHLHRRIMEHCARHHDDNLSKISEVLREGIRTGVFQDISPEDTVLALRGITHALMFRWYRTGKQYSLASKGLSALKILFCGVASAKGKRQCEAYFERKATRKGADS